MVVSLIITVLFGILMMYSASSIIAIKHYGFDSDFFLRSQLNNLFIGTIGLIICIGIPFYFWKKRIISVCIAMGNLLNISILNKKNK
ncbi:FtsW/RodA/SpoVE family cell cycle protein [Bacillus thuringiensis]|uniref:FtsW/RodA/SpoVE family cell cycle protein n=1 Tax=Bacillus thuringiensis TaxID=1428 RepID=UPI0030B94230